MRATGAVRRATGIVRRIDSLGRVVIPKEIRKTMHIREGDPLEIYVEPTGEIIFKKYSTIDELGDEAEKYSNLLAKMTDVSVIISDRERVVAVSSNRPKSDIIGKSVSSEYDKLMQGRKTYIATKESVLYPIQNVPYKGLVCVPIISCGDLSGSVILLDEKSELPTETQIKLAQFVAGLFGQKISE